MLRTLSLLRSLTSAHHSLEEARTTIQQARDYRWLAERLERGVIVAPATALEDGTPAVALVLAFPATPRRLAGGNWPAEAEARERCLVEGAHACRAAGAPGYRTLESLSQGLVHGAVNVLADAARFQYLQRHRALRLTWRRFGHLPEPLSQRLTCGGETGRQGLLLLELRVPGRPPTGTTDGAWLDRRLDRYRRILPATPPA